MRGAKTVYRRVTGRDGDALIGKETPARPKSRWTWSSTPAGFRSTSRRRRPPAATGDDVRPPADDQHRHADLQHAGRVPDGRARFGPRPDLSALGTVHRRRQQLRRVGPADPGAIRRQGSADQAARSSTPTAASPATPTPPWHWPPANSSPSSTTTTRSPRSRCSRSSRRSTSSPDADLIYSDEDKLDETGRRVDPYFKPDWSPDTLRSHNYICHLLVLRRTLVAIARRRARRVRRGPGLRPGPAGDRAGPADRPHPEGALPLANAPAIHGLRHQEQDLHRRGRVQGARPNTWSGCERRPACCRRRCSGPTGSSTTCRGSRWCRS